MIVRDSITNPTDMRWVEGAEAANQFNKWWYNPNYNSGARWYRDKDTGLDGYWLALPNCTTYAVGRLEEIANRNLRSASNEYEFLTGTGFPSAQYWYGRANWSTSQYAEEGDIACWEDTTKEYGGHVAIVEKTDGNGTPTYLSYSGYVALQDIRQKRYPKPGDSGYYFTYASWATTVSRYEGFCKMKFQGFIKNPYTHGQIPPTPGEKDFIVTLKVNPAGAGYCTGAGEYNYGERAWLEAIPYSGYKFVNWSDGYDQAIRYWDITSNLTLTANFTKNSGLYMIRKRKGGSLIKYV